MAILGGHRQFFHRRIVTVDGCHFFLVDYTDEEMDDGFVREEALGCARDSCCIGGDEVNYGGDTDVPIPGEEAPTDPRTADRSDLHQVRPAPKGFRKSRLALPRAPQRQADTSSQPAVLRPEHRVMETIIAIALIALVLAITMKGDNR